MTNAFRTVPFFRPSIGQAEIDAVTNCMKSGWLTTGPHARAFEQEFSALMGEGVAAISVNSATAAMHLGLDALGVGPGDEVIVPSLTFTATAEVVRYMGATPVFVDVDRRTLCIDPALIEAAITPRTKMIMPVHFAGHPCDMTAICAIAQAHGLKVLDDAAHALPCRHDGALIGGTNSLADATAFSFYANKTMTTGEGGMLTTRDPEVAQRARVMRLHGIDRDVYNRFSDIRASWIYDVIAPGYKYNLTDMAAALGRVQLARIDEFQDKRSALAARYREAFDDLPVILPPAVGEGDLHSWHLYLLQLTDAAPLTQSGFIEALKEAGVGTSVHYRPLHQMTYWASLGSTRAFPNCDEYFSRCVSIPHFMDMREEEQSYVIDTIRALLS
jgi:dTDP-4-amino-4,6-dideoxygalactose transaminase